jgi:hypothetical protein
VRESTIAQLASESAAARLARAEQDVPEASSAGSARSARTESQLVLQGSEALSARTESHLVLEGSEAVWAQARLARTRAREVREHARILQTRREAARR